MFGFIFVISFSPLFFVSFSMVFVCFRFCCIASHRYLSLSIEYVFFFFGRAWSVHSTYLSSIYMSFEWERAITKRHIFRWYLLSDRKISSQLAEYLEKKVIFGFKRLFISRDGSKFQWFWWENEELPKKCPRLNMYLHEKAKNAYLALNRIPADDCRGLLLKNC